MPGSAPAEPGRGAVTYGWGGDSPCPRAGGLAARDFPGERWSPAAIMQLSAGGGGGDLVAAGLVGDRQDGEPLDLLDPERLAVGGLDRQAPGMMLRIVESSHFTAYNAGDFCLGDGAR